MTVPTPTPTPVIGPTEAPELHVMTYNIRRRLDLTPMPADRWPRRRAALAALLRAERPAVLGVQEALPDQAEWVRDALGGEYRFVGRGRGRESRGEGCPLFYDTDRLDLRGGAQRWLSDSPETEGSMGWGNRVPRVLVRADLRDRATGAEFTVINTHLDVLSRPARLRSASRLRRLAGENPAPTIVMGDMNADEDSPTVAALLGGGTLVDAWRAAATRVTPEWGTMGGYRTPRTGSGRIDLIAVSPTITVTRAGINAHQFAGRWPSDHLPVHAAVRLPERDS